VRETSGSIKLPLLIVETSRDTQTHNQKLNLEFYIKIDPSKYVGHFLKLQVAINARMKNSG